MLLNRRVDEFKLSSWIDLENVMVIGKSKLQKSENDVTAFM